MLLISTARNMSEVFRLIPTSDLLSHVGQVSWLSRLSLRARSGRQYATTPSNSAEHHTWASFILPPAWIRSSWPSLSAWELIDPWVLCQANLNVILLFQLWERRRPRWKRHHFTNRPPPKRLKPPLTPTIPEKTSDPTPFGNTIIDNGN